MKPVLSKTNLEWDINTPYMITVHTGKNDLVRYLDDKVWLAGEGEDVIIPRGRHTLKFEPNPCHFNNIACLNYISGELKWADFMDNVIEFSYAEYSSHCYAIISMKPNKIYIDEKPVKCMIFQANNKFSIKLPKGKHKVRIEA